jgi:L-amino acid N-acyltransferase YncA
MIVRAASPADGPAMTAILNANIRAGGTTAHEVEKTEAAVVITYITGPDVLSSVVAEDGGQVVGWQSAGLHKDEAHIGTFVAPGIQARGAGSAMFALTCDILRAARVPSIVATIRADNVPGLAFYARAGFKDFARDPDFALRDGTVVGRVHRRFVL